MAKSIKRIKREKKGVFKPMMYICAPFGGEVKKNTERAIRLAKIAYQQGNMPVIPHVQYPFMDDNNPIDRRNDLNFDLILMGKCQEVWVLGSTVTNGMKAELQLARKHRQLIRWFDEDYKEVK